MSKIKDLAMKDESTKLPAAPDDVANELDAFNKAANQNLRGKFLGTLLLYKKEIGAPKGGRFRFGENKIELPIGTSLIALMREIYHGHRMWRGGRIVGEAIYKLIDRPYLDRSALGDLNEDDWPISEITGKQEDPWQHYVFLPLSSLDGKTFYTFSAKSFYGREAVYGLGDRYQRLARQHVGQYPVVKLGSEIKHSKKFGEIPAPSFEITGWATRPTLALEDHSQPEANNDTVAEGEFSVSGDENPAAGMTDIDEVDFTDFPEDDFVGENEK
jgi:hypothetical protein